METVEKKKMNIPIAKTVFSDAEFENIVKPLHSGWVVQGPFVKEFEEKWSAFTSSKYSIATSNCTTGLHLSLAALGVGEGDEVIVPAFTWVATANSAEYMKAKPVFCDIDLETNNIDVSKIEELITDKTKAIIPVHLFGLSADMDKIMDIAKKYKLFIVEDAACGFASYYKGRHVGTIGDTGAFSFHPRKAITTGEGGMITTSSEKLDGILRAIRDHGATTSDHQRHHGARPYILPEFPYLGYNFRMTDIQASIGSTQMDRAKEIHDKRAYWASRYDEILSNVGWIKTPFRHEDYEHGYQSYVCLFDPENTMNGKIGKVNAERNKFMDYLQKEGISTRPGTHAVHMLGYYKEKYGFAQTDFPNAYAADQCTITFPVYPSMSEEEFIYVKEAIINYKPRN
ncbi:DegT/DnrJ/EryC1/StrS family aminotransferase [soil metagenome]